MLCITLLFLLINLMVMLLAGDILNLFGVISTHEVGNTLQLANLLVLCFVFASLSMLKKRVEALHNLQIT